MRLGGLLSFTFIPCSVPWSPASRITLSHWQPGIQSIIGPLPFPLITVSSRPAPLIRIRIGLVRSSIACGLDDVADLYSTYPKVRPTLRYPPSLSRPSHTQGRRFLCSTALRSVPTPCARAPVPHRLPALWQWTYSPPHAYAYAFRALECVSPWPPACMHARAP
ncbi:hypothetical protein VTO73DRAFT_9105 [Trametes versicolor]